VLPTQEIKMSDSTADLISNDPTADDTPDESSLYLERLAEALLRLGIIEMEGIVVDGSEVAGAIMALDAQLTAGWQLAESVRWARETEARLETTDRSAAPDAWEVASLDHQKADTAIVVALQGWDEAAGLDEDETNPSVSDA
jgi:hypothetical protein